MDEDILDILGDEDGFTIPGVKLELWAKVRATRLNDGDLEEIPALVGPIKLIEDSDIYMVLDQLNLADIHGNVTLDDMLVLTEKIKSQLLDSREWVRVKD